MRTIDDRKRARLRRAVGQLPSPQRKVYWLVAVRGLDHDAAARCLGIGTGEVEARLAEALVLLGAHLAPDAAAD